MNFSELVVAVAKDAQLSRKATASVLYSLGKVVKHALMSDVNVKLREFGEFYVIQQTPRVVFGNKKRRAKKLIRFRESRYGQARSRDR